ncbi:hypothetical protein T01_193 [Trichinella spiralis]|uniref:Uncharacterized protein n=1 Tax=Trichinella spiralis TaxID=6334 RepID=A0A0V1AIS2_TRISP|nr:hypothetical protein T01_193 [Trichinella spiralis]
MLLTNTEILAPVGCSVAAAQIELKMLSASLGEI